MIEFFFEHVIIKKGLSFSETLDFLSSFSKIDSRLSERLSAYFKDNITLQEYYFEKDIKDTEYERKFISKQRFPR